ncbi:MAG TPA: polysaccharide deacetylase family protein [Acidimicrobiales bacterium]|nr:polysaccharide deacetylase family protein [Acidimicrobiales bacterium]
MSLLITRNRSGIPVRIGAGAGLAVVAMPLASWGTQSTGAALITVVAAVSVGATVAVLVARLVPRPRAAWFGAVLVAASALLVAVTPRGAISLPIAVVTGVGVGLVLPLVPPFRDRVSWTALAGAVAVGGLLLAVAGATVALWFATALAIGATVVNMLAGSGAERGRFTVGITLGSGIWAVALMAWVAANTPTVNWFGGTISHGPRDRNQVALSFDDGPDDRYTLAVRDILDAHGVKATFFTVGKALDARPDISQALLADGQLLGDHSYHHDYWRWLDPRYPELDRTQDAFQRNLGVCPGFFRPPHGQRTPFMSWLVDRRDMAMVTWDVSAADWSSHDGTEVAAGVLKRVKPGSIILLHDGLDGKVHSDRSVLLTALPLILDGLKQRGLQPVRLDQLLGRPGYVPC